MPDLLTQLSTHARQRPTAIAYREILPTPPTPTTHPNPAAPARTLTYADLLSATSTFAEQLRSTFPPGSTLILRIPNTCDYPIAFLATLAAGHAAFPVPPDISDPELHHAITQSSAAALIGPSLSLIPQSALRNPQSRTGLLLQSSGTTGRPKIVHRPLPTLDAVSSNMVSALGLTESDLTLATVPLCHSYGLEHGLLAPLYAGATTHLCQGFHLHLVLDQLAHHGITTFPAVPSMFEMLAQLAGDSTFPTLRLPYSAGGPLPHHIAQSFQQKYHLPISQLYGATEIGSATFAHPNNPHFDPRSVGQPMPGVKIRITPSQLGTRNSELGTNPEGEIQIKATSMFTGYLTGEPVLTPDCFFPTGDLGHLDAHQNLTITGRLKLLIDVGGLKVNPLEVEDVLREHPGVAACVVVPVKLSDTISRVKAVIQPTDPLNPPAAEDLRQFARARLTPHKVPRVIEFRPSLPTSPTGKILRHLVEA